MEHLGMNAATSPSLIDFKIYKGRHDTQHNDTQHNDTQYKELSCDTQHK